MGSVPRIIGRVFVQRPSLDLRTAPMEPRHHPNNPWLRADVPWLHIDPTGGLGRSTLCVLLWLLVAYQAISGVRDSTFLISYLII